MDQENSIEIKIRAISEALSSSEYFDPGSFTEHQVDRTEKRGALSKLDNALRTARRANRDLDGMAIWLHDNIITPIFQLEPLIREPKYFHELRRLLERLLTATENLRKEREHVRELVTFHARLVAVYILILYRCGSPGHQSPIMWMIFRNIARRKATELGARQIDQLAARIRKCSNDSHDCQEICRLYSGSPWK